MNPKAEPFFARFLETQELSEEQVDQVSGGSLIVGSGPFKPTLPSTKPPVQTLAFPSDSDLDIIKRFR